MSYWRILENYEVNGKDVLAHLGKFHTREEAVQQCYEIIREVPERNGQLAVKEYEDDA
jgi:hypothetical protein